MWTERSIPNTTLGALVLFAGALCLASACGRAETGAAGSVQAAPGAEPSQEEPMPTTTFALTSTAFKDGETIPAKYTDDGQDVSPPLKWTDPPKETESFALIADDPDAPRGTWVHWVAYRIPGQLRELKEGVPKSGETPDGVMQGTNDFGKTGYGGPAPPPGKPHRYYFKLYALDFTPRVEAGLTKEELLRAIEGHVLAEAQIMGTYGR